MTNPAPIQLCERLLAQGRVVAVRGRFCPEHDGPPPYYLQPVGCVAAYLPAADVRQLIAAAAQRELDDSRAPDGTTAYPEYFGERVAAAVLRASGVSAAR